MATSPCVRKVPDLNGTPFGYCWAAFDYQFRRERRWFGWIRIHKWVASDPYPPHDHGCFNVSIVLEGEMAEEYGSSLWGHGKKVRRLRAGDVVIRSPWASHHLRTEGALTLYYSHPEFFYWRFNHEGAWVSGGPRE
jgi:mannose-6-phosphate isomerase-like protein (cupin superfamily)